MKKERSFFLVSAILVSLILAVTSLVGCASSILTTTPTPTVQSQTTKTSSPPTQVLSTTSTSPILPSPTTSVTPKPVTWRAVTFLPKNMFSVKNIYAIAERAKQRSNGQLTIEYLGGPEVIPAPNQAEAVRKGVVQMSIVSVTTYDGLVPLSNVMDLSELSPAEELSTGAYDIINQYHQNAGIFYLGRGTSSLGNMMMLMMKQSIERPQQLTGKKVGATTASLVPFLKTIGASPVIVSQPEIYTALERGTVDGFHYTLPNIVDSQLYSVAKYIIDHAYYRGAVSIIVNLGSWNQLPSNLQQMMTKIAQEVIVEYSNDFEKELGIARQKCIDNGVKFIKFSDVDQQWFYTNLYDSAWAEASRLHPEEVAKLRPLLTKKK
jgi:TRAP-type C4-dicarboxylate transport system substrate-binding protein